MELKKSLFADYYLEERGETVIESEKGFITYKVFDAEEGKSEKEIMICDFYVDPLHRHTKEPKRLADTVCEIGKSQGCTHVSCYIQHPERNEKQRKKTTYKLRTFIHYGMILHSMNESQILLYKNL